MRFWQEVDGALVRLAASKADKVRDALADSINAQQVADDFLRTHPADTKVTPTQARDWARLHVTPKTLPLLSVIREAYAEAYTLGQDAALAAYAHARLTKAADAQPSGDDLRASLQFDWSKWKAGNRPASLLLSPKNGLKGLLSNAGQTIKGMNDTSLSRVGTILSDALARGRGSDAAARTLITDGIDGMLTSASRAQTIAVTEMARATQIAQMDSYRDYGIEYVEWVDIDADDDCATNAEQGPIPIGQEFDSGDTEPPAHPNCRCAIVPAFPDDAELPSLADETTAEPEIETDHSDAIAQGIEAVVTELHPDMAVETTGLEAAASNEPLADKIANDLPAKAQALHNEMVAATGDLNLQSVFGGLEPEQQAWLEAKLSAQGLSGQQRDIAYKGAVQQLRFVQNRMTPEQFVKDLDTRHPETKAEALKWLEDAKQFISNADVSINLEPNVLEKVIESGSYLNQFETLSSGGVLDLEGRAAAEYSFMGLDATATANERPVYGALVNDYTGKASILNKDNYWNEVGKANSGFLQQYGHVTMTLNDEIKNRSVFTVGDSLDKFLYKPVMASSLAGEVTTDKLVTSGIYDTMYGLGTLQPYVETQIQGGVTLQDVKTIWLPLEKEWSSTGIVENLQATQAKADELDSKLKGMGYNIEVKIKEGK